MRKLEVVLIGIVVILSIAVVLQFTNGQASNASSQSSTQSPFNPNGVSQTINSQGSTDINGQVGSTGTENSTLTQIFKKVENSVVQITSKVSTIDNSVIINGQPLGSQSTRLGSGFVYDKEGRIITNNHVVEGVKSVDVTFIDGNTYTAKVVGTDPDNDLAVIQITDNFSDESLTPLPLGSSSNLEVGQQVIAIGNPFGLADSMTTGIISQIGRLLPNQNAGFSIPDIIQVDAAINPGNSGGPLLNMRGEVVGINTAITTNTGDFAGIGFAVPAGAMERIVPVLIKNGSYSHPYLGIAGGSLNPDISVANGLPRNFKGVMVEKVVKGGPADKAGVTAATLDQNNMPRSGDIITAIDGNKVKTIYDVIVYLDEQKNVGDKVVITVNRLGKSVDLTATLEPRPSPSS
jgi:S1-C subfamily serine protease